MMRFIMIARSLYRPNVMGKTKKRQFGKSDYQYSGSMHMRAYMLDPFMMSDNQTRVFCSPLKIRRQVTNERKIEIQVGVDQEPARSLSLNSNVEA